MLMRTSQNIVRQILTRLVNEDTCDSDDVRWISSSVHNILCSLPETLKHCSSKPILPNTNSLASADYEVAQNGKNHFDICTSGICNYTYNLPTIPEHTLSRGISPSHLVLPAQHFTISQSQFSPVHHLTWYSQPSPLYIHVHPDCSPQLKIGFQCVAILCQKILQNLGEWSLTPLVFWNRSRGQLSQWCLSSRPCPRIQCCLPTPCCNMSSQKKDFCKLEWKNHVARLKI